MKIIGHRGAAGLMPENTTSSILKAIELKVDWIEIDVWKTADDEIIVFHDAYLDRLTSRSGFIKQLDYKTIRLATLTNGEHIPTLQEITDLIKKTGLVLLVEVKSEDAFERTLGILLHELPESQFVIGSFFHRQIKEIKERNSLIQTSIMFESVPVLLDAYLKEVNPDYVTISIETYNHYLVETIKKQNRKLIFYTINTKPEIEMALKENPYGIVTNFPNLFMSRSDI